MAIIDRQYLRTPFYGSRRMTAWLQTQGLTDQIIAPPALVRAGLETLPAIIRAQGERAGRRFIEFFTATIRNRNPDGVRARGKTILRLVRGPSPRAG